MSWRRPLPDLVLVQSGTVCCRNLGLELSGVEVGADGKPANNTNPTPYIMGFLAMILVAWMMRHVFELSDITTIGKGLVSGFGIGLFLAAP